MTTSDIFVKILEEQGIEYCFALPGEENLDFLEAIRKSKIKLIVTRHEQAAAFMAATYGRLTGKPGVCMSTLGPGALNLVNGVAYAQLGGMPLIAITGQKALLENWQAKFQIVDVVGVMRPITKWAVTVPSPRSMGKTVHHALTVARDERPGAVHIEIPEDIAGMEYADELFPQNIIANRRPVADEKAIKIAADIIKRAKSPIIIVSSGGNRKLVTKQLRNLVDATGLYVIGTQLGKGVLPDDHRHSLFSLGMHRRDYVNEAIDTSDLIVTVGYSTIEHPPFVWNKKKDKKILHIDFSPVEPDEFYLPTFQVVGDISHTLWALQEQLRGTRFETGLFENLRTKLELKHLEKSGSAQFPLIPQRIVHDVRALMGREDIVTLDNGIYKLWFARQYHTFAPNTLLLDNTLATMGAGLPSAMAAKLLYPHKNVLAVCGDGGFMMNSQEMITCVKENIPVVVLILNDNAFGFIEWKQRNMKLPDYGMKLENPDFVKYAEAYGALGLRVESAEDLIPTLRQAFASGRPAIVECPIDYSENIKVLNEELSALNK